ADREAEEAEESGLGRGHEWLRIGPAGDRRASLTRDVRVCPDWTRPAEYFERRAPGGCPIPDRPGCRRHSRATQLAGGLEVSPDARACRLPRMLRNYLAAAVRNLARN